MDLILKQMDFTLKLMGFQTLVRGRYRNDGYDHPDDALPQSVPT